MAHPKYESRNVSQGTRPKRSSAASLKRRPVHLPPPDMRSVITSTGGGVNGGVQVVHWCPKEGTEWTCSEKHCGMTFVRDEEKASWRQR